MDSVDTTLLLFTLAALFAAGIAIGINVGKQWATDNFRDRLAEALGEE